MIQIYRTNQRKIILQFLTASLGGHLTADGVFSALKKNGHVVGKATIYRYLDKLTNEGRLRKYASLDGGSAGYEYVKEACAGHNHLKCDSCGKLLHLECEDVSKLYQHIDKVHGFKVDRARTVFLGLCCECADNTAKRD